MLSGKPNLVHQNCWPVWLYSGRFGCNWQFCHDLRAIHTKDDIYNDNYIGIHTNEW